MWSWRPGVEVDRGACACSLKSVNKRYSRTSSLNERESQHTSSVRSSTSLLLAVISLESTVFPDLSNLRLNALHILFVVRIEQRRIDE